MLFAHIPLRCSDFICTSGQQLDFILSSYCFFEFLWRCLHCNYSNPLARDVEESIHRCLPTWGFFADLILCIQNDNPKKTEPWLDIALAYHGDGDLCQTRTTRLSR